MSDLTLLIYLSRAVNPPDIPLLEEWGGRFSENNRKLRVTGLLMTIGDHFVQLLEGEHDKVMALAQTIKADARHTAFRIVYQKPASQRFFGLWSMRFLSLDDQLHVGTAEFNALRRHVRDLIGKGDVPKAAFLELLQALPAVLQRHQTAQPP
ncbi:MAG: BLUF domain-containing protein [Pseudomonadota bacterium]